MKFGWLGDNLFLAYWWVVVCVKQQIADNPRLSKRTKFVTVRYSVTINLINQTKLVHQTARIALSLITMTAQTTAEPAASQIITAQYRPLVIGIVAGEVSGDALGADFMRQMNNLRDDIVWVGVGGSQMQAAGLQSVIEMSRLAVMGLSEVVKHLPDLLNAKAQILRAFADPKPDIFIGIDAPDFNLRLAKALKPKGVYCVQYVSPSIWAWREGRIESIKQATHLVLCLFPFELPVYAKHGHPAVCVGHPLLKTLDPALTTTPMLDQRLALIWAQDDLREFFADTPDISALIALLPGSRSGEIRALLPTLFASVRRLLIIDKRLCFIIPATCAEHQQLLTAELAQQPKEVRARVVVTHNPAQADFGQRVMAIADLVLLASGTATFEAMLLTRPMVVVYRLKPLSFWLAKKLVKIPYVALPNILAGRLIVPELLQNDATADSISRTVYKTLSAPAYQNQQRALAETCAHLRAQSNTNPANAVVEGWLAWLSGNN